MKFKGYALILSGFCIVIFLFQFAILSFTGFFLLDESSWIQPWRFITAIFLHGSFSHLLYNLFALALFGSILEGIIGGRRFLIVFFITGILANLIAVNFYPSSLGASGAIFGVIGAITIVRPTLIVWAYGLPMPMFIAGALWAIGDIIGIFVPSNVGNIAHLAGLAAGLIIGAFYRDWNKSDKSENSLVLDERNVRKWEEENFRI